MFGRKKQKRRENGHVWLCSNAAYETLCCDGYVRLTDNPEVQMGVNYIADMISSMTIYLMANGQDGDHRIVNELSRRIDINPYKTMTRKTWMFNAVRNAIIYGNQVIYPHTDGTWIGDLEPFPPAEVTLEQTVNNGYVIRYKGKEYEPDEVIHFQTNPKPDCPWIGMGYQAALKEVVRNLKQAAATKKAFMESKWKPSVIIKVDALTDEFASKEGREKLLEDYIGTANEGEPWLIPAERFEVEQIKPLSLNDLAINEAVTLDKKTVAGILRVPPYAVGAGEYKKDEHRHFVNTTIMPIAQMIQQELTKKLLIAPDMYFLLSSRALYGYDMQELSDVGKELYVRGIMTGNEVRDWLNLPPISGLDERVILENYIPAGMIGQQKKLKGGGEE